MHSKNYTTIKELASNYLIEEGEFSTANYLRICSIIIRGVTKLNLFVTKNVKTARLEISDINTVELPSDCVKTIRVGLNMNERVYTLTQNPNIVLNPTTDCGAEYRDNTSSNANIQSSPFFINGAYFTTLYGLHGGYNMYYRVDKLTNTISLEGEMPADTTILVEYISSGVSIDSDTVIPLEMTECLLAWIRWRLDTGNEQKKNMYGIEERLLRNLHYSFSVDDLLDAQYLGSSQTVKR